MAICILGTGAGLQQRLHHDGVADGDGGVQRGEPFAVLVVQNGRSLRNQTRGDII